MIKCIAISDTHYLHNQMPSIPVADLLICSGDFTNNNKHVFDSRIWLDHVKGFAEFLSKQFVKERIVIAGNHDFGCEKYPKEAKQIFADFGCKYLQDEPIEFQGHKIYGAPWTPWFHDWAFNIESNEALEAVWKNIPEDTEVLVTHGPPKGILDKTLEGDFAGCEQLLYQVKSLTKLKYHIFGHIHEGFGVKKCGGITFINASICNRNYEPDNLPTSFEL